MAKLDFPDRDQSPWTNPDNGITYVWKGGTQGAWHIASAGDTDIFVAKAGDKMTGDLTLGPEGDTNITLNATDGSATFAEDVQVGGRPLFDPGVDVRNTGSIVVTSNFGGAALDFRRMGSSESQAAINTDGSATFADGNLGINANGRITSNNVAGGFHVDSIVPTNAAFAVLGSPDPYCTIMGNGSATFVGSVDVGTATAGIEYGIYAKVNRDKSGSATSAAITARNYAVGGLNFRGQNTTSGATSCQIYEDGSADFVGKVSGGYFQSKSSQFQFTTVGDAAVWQNAEDANASSTAFQAGYGSGSGTQKSFVVTNNGNITGNLVRSAGFQIELERDNDANYTVTGTEEYEEQEELTPYVPATYDEYGNELTAEVQATYQTVTKTRDVRTYTGPTLDVKERLQNLIARLDSLEAEELADDATSTLLLTTVNNLNADMTKTKAALTAIRTAANAAGTLEQLKADIATATADI